MMPASCRWNVPDGGFYVWLSLPPGIDAKAMLPRAVTARVAYVPGHGVLRRRVRLRRDPALLLLPHPGADPGGRTPPRGRHRGGDGAAGDVRGQRPDARGRLSAATTVPAPTCRRAQATSRRARPHLPADHRALQDRLPGARPEDRHPAAPTTSRATGGVLLACNHIGYVDFVYGGLAANPSGRKVRFMAKRELFDHKLTGPLMRSMHHIEVDRGEGLAVLRHRRRLPQEPARRSGSSPRPPSPGPWSSRSSRPARCGSRPQAGVPLVPVVMWGTQRMMTKDHPQGLLPRQDDPAPRRGADAPHRVPTPSPRPPSSTGSCRRCSTRPIRDYPAGRAAARVVVAAEAVSAAARRPSRRRPRWTPRRSASEPRRRLSRRNDFHYVAYRFVDISAFPQVGAWWPANCELSEAFDVARALP